MTANKTFPVLMSNRCVAEVPWDIAAEAYKEYAARYSSVQSMERLAQRGGFGISELLMLLHARCKRLSDGR